MVQFYALSVFFNILAGLILSVGQRENKTATVERLSAILSEKSIKFSAGLLSIVIGFFKFLTPTAGDIAVIGDLLPAVSGMALGIVLLIDFFRASSDIDSATLDRMESFFQGNKQYIGIGGIVAGILHFLMPAVPLI